jgi:hypothetical protein
MIVFISISAVHSTDSPLRIFNVQLEADKAFDVWTGSSQERDLIRVPKTPCRICLPNFKTKLHSGSRPMPKSRTPVKFCCFVSNDRERYCCIVLWLTVEITNILQNGLRKIVKEKVWRDLLSD